MSDHMMDENYKFKNRTGDDLTSNHQIRRAEHSLNKFARKLLGILKRETEFLLQEYGSLLYLYIVSNKH